MALSLISEMYEAVVELDTTSYTSGVNACETGRNTEQALSFISDMLEMGLEPGFITSSDGAKRRNNGYGCN